MNSFAQNNEKNHEEAKLSSSEILNQRYSTIQIDNDFLKVKKKTIEKRIGNEKLFDLTNNAKKSIVAENIKFEFLGTTYLNCVLLEYKEIKGISEFATEKYYELRILKEEKILAIYQTKDLYVGGVYYREKAEIISLQNIDLSTRFVLFPNPFENETMLETKDNIVDKNIVVLSAEGKDVTSQFQFVVFTNNKIKITSKSNLKKGVYILSIITDEYVLSKKLIKS